jgi:hypothetical protein
MSHFAAICAAKYYIVRVAGAVVAEPSQERGLAHACLPGDQYQAAARAAPHRIQALAEHRQLALALYEVAHDSPSSTRLRGASTTYAMQRRRSLPIRGR